MTYAELRHFADSWFLLAMTLTFVSFVAWALRPGSKQQQDETARSILSEDEPHG